MQEKIAGLRYCPAIRAFSSQVKSPDDSENAVHSENAMIMGWSERQVSAIRKRYVDEAAIVVAIDGRIAGNV